MPYPRISVRTTGAKEQRIAEILALLSEKEMSRAEIEKETGLGHTTINNYVGLLHSDGLVYISSYGSGKYGSIARYSAGEFDDVPKPGNAYTNRRKRIEHSEDERKQTVVNVRRDPYLWLTAGRQI